MTDRCALWAGLAVSCLLSGRQIGAQGQRPAPTPIPAVEVVATRLPESPHDVPAAIEVIDGSDLRARGAKSLGEALALAAGVAIAPGSDGGPAGAVPEFWGLREFDAFLLVVDGVPWGGALNPAVATLNLRDVERIEILRGPAPVTYGATSFVGVIHVVHKAAAATGRTVEAFGGTFGTGGLALDLAGPSLGSWNSRVSAGFDRRGFKDDHTSYSSGHALLRTARVQGASQMWLTATLNVVRQDPASPHPREGASLSQAVPLDANHNPSGAFINENRMSVAAGWQRPVMGNASWGTTASYTFSGQSMFRGFLVDLSNTADNAAGFKENIDINDLYADTYIIWPEKSHVRFITGADALFAAGEGKGATFSYTVPLNGATQTAVAEPSTLNADAEDERRFLGAYTSAEWRPNARFNLSGGVRLNATSEKRGEGGEVGHARLSGSLGAMYGLWERGANHLRAFVSYRNTFKPAAFDFSLAENEGVLDPETSGSYEAGLKARTRGGLVDIELSAFRMDFENLVTATVVNNLPALINAGKTRFQGVELATDVRLPRSVFARATYSHHDGKFVDFVQAFGGVPTQLAGNRFEMSARNLGSFGLTLAPERGFIANFSAGITGSRYLNKRNTALVGGFPVIDAGIGYRTDRLEVRLDGRNLSDRRDAVSESEFGDAQYYRMPARSIRTAVLVNY